MWEWALIAGGVIVGLTTWLAVRRSAGRRSSQDGDAGTTFLAADGGGHSSSATSDWTDTSGDGSGCDGAGGSDGGSCDGGGGD